LTEKRDIDPNFYLKKQDKLEFTLFLSNFVEKLKEKLNFLQVLLLPKKVSLGPKQDVGHFPKKRDYPPQKCADGQPINIFIFKCQKL
jgi:hypothetical protein